MNDEMRSVWNDLQQRAASALRLTELFEHEPDRVDRMTFSTAGLSADFSKNLLELDTVTRLADLAAAAGLSEAIRTMFGGGTINRTEQRAVLHTALRAGPDSTAAIAGERVAPEIESTLAKMREFVDAVRGGRWTGYSGERLTDIVNIGIGGSHLGPQLACEALRYNSSTVPRTHFLANVDGGEFDRIVAPLDPESTLFIVASKSFTTVETRLNATSARAWLAERFPQKGAVSRHFAAVSAAPERAVEFGLDAANVFPMWDWVGGRYSVWSAIGLPVALCIGMDDFEAMLAGAAEMDQHFLRAPFAENLPVLLALIGIWNNNFLGAESYAVVPYDDRLRHLPDYLQQLEMESNGKQVTLTNEATEFGTAPITWGGLGTNAQHAFFQLLHQGTRLVPTDFIVALTHPSGRIEHHDMLVANCFAQAEGLMIGRPAAAAGEATAAGVDLPLHKSIPGNNPSSMITLHALTPRTLGALIALYEHKTYVQSVIWNINAFDQWGVEIGKDLATGILQEISAGKVDAHHDASTAALIRHYLETRRP